MYVREAHEQSAVKETENNSPRLHTSRELREFFSRPEDEQDRILPNG